jgi:putative oxidoreductase
MSTTVNVAFLILRLVGGLTIAAHGAQKLFGWFGGPGFTRFAAGMQSAGLKPGPVWTSLSILGEVGGGLSVAFGFLTPLGAAGMVGSMFMAIAKRHWKNGFFSSAGGLEFPLQVLTIATAIGIAGPGAYSLDAWFSIKLPEAALFLILAVAAVLVDLSGLAISRPPAAASATPAPSRP